MPVGLNRVQRLTNIALSPIQALLVFITRRCSNDNDQNQHAMSESKITQPHDDVGMNDHSGLPQK